MTFFGIEMEVLVQSLGYIGLFSIVFAESGLPIGFFLPGGSMLFVAGVLASQDFFNIYILSALLTLGAMAGDSTGYWLGKKAGLKIFNKEDSFFFKKKHLEKTRIFYEKHGARAVVLGRFIPIVRTFVPILAGVALMPYRKFLKYNVLGALFWALGMTLLGYFSGKYAPDVKNYLLPVVLLIVILSILPIVWEFCKRKIKNNNL